MQIPASLEEQESAATLSAVLSGGGGQERLGSCTSLFPPVSTSAPHHPRLPGAGCACVCFPDGGELFLSALSQSHKGKLMADRGDCQPFTPAPMLPVCLCGSLACGP